MQDHRFRALTNLWTRLVEHTGSALNTPETLRLLDALRREYEAVERDAYVLGVQEGLTAATPTRRRVRVAATPSPIDDLGQPAEARIHDISRQVMAPIEQELIAQLDTHERLVRQKQRELDAALADGTATVQ